MPYKPSQPRVPAGSPEGGEWTSSSFHTDAAQWIHPSTGEKRIYINNHGGGSADKIWIHAGNSDTSKPDSWDASMKSMGGYPSSSSVSIAGSSRPHDIALNLSEKIIVKHGLKRNSSFDTLWNMARPVKLSRSEFEKLSPVIKMSFARNGGKIID